MQSLQALWAAAIPKQVPHHLEYPTGTLVDEFDRFTKEYANLPALDFFGVPLTHTGNSVRLVNGFEAGGSIQLVYGSMIADVVYSKIGMGVGPSTIVGEDATLAINDLAEPSNIVILERRGHSQVLLDIDDVKPADTMHHELIAFADQVEDGAIVARWKNLTVASRRIMDEHLARH